MVLPPMVLNVIQLNPLCVGCIGNAVAAALVRAAPEVI
jgi:hypothetical protein